MLHESMKQNNQMAQGSKERPGEGTMTRGGSLSAGYTPTPPLHVNTCNSPPTCSPFALSNPMPQTKFPSPSPRP